jgi:hypothetical protein
MYLNVQEKAQSAYRCGRGEGWYNDRPTASAVFQVQVITMKKGSLSIQIQKADTEKVTRSEGIGDW